MAIKNVFSLQYFSSWVPQTLGNTPNSASLTGWNDKIVVLKKTTLNFYFKTIIEKINSGNLIM